jgi:replication factor C subunit 2/4
VAVAGAIPADTITALIALMRQNLLDRAMVMMDSVLKDGFPALQILTQLAEAVVVRPWPSLVPRPLTV